MAERQIFENMGRRAAQKSLLGRLMIIPLAAACDVTSGNLWLPVVGCTGCAPWLAAKMRGMAQASEVMLGSCPTGGRLFVARLRKSRGASFAVKKSTQQRVSHGLSLPSIEGCELYL